MGFLFIDDSKHASSGFCLASAVYSDVNPTARIDQVLRDHGLQPGIDEFKASRRITDPEAHASLRGALTAILMECQIALAVVSNEEELGPGSLALVARMLGHPSLSSVNHQAFFDEGLFRSVGRAMSLAQAAIPGARCVSHFEQSSCVVRGIQLADLAVHTCATMLRQELNLVTKSVVLGEDYGYSPDWVVPLSFELWAPIRRSFLSVPSTGPESDEEFYDVASFGLHLSGTLDGAIAEAAQKRFGTTFMGCLH